MTNTDNITTRGYVEAIIEYKDRPTEVIHFSNTVLRLGRQALANCLTNNIGGSFDFFVSTMLFGDGGTSGGIIKFVSTERNGLFGITRANKPVMASIDPTCPTQAIFTSVLTFQDANGFTLSEMALQMNTGDFYSMATFPDLNKTSQMQITWNWRCSFV